MFQVLEEDNAAAGIGKSMVEAEAESECVCVVCTLNDCQAPKWLQGRLMLERGVVLHPYYLIEVRGW